jgi:anti-sigma B factor antagonist
MKVEIEYPQEGKVILRPNGRMDADNSSDLKMRIQDIAKERNITLIMDLQFVNYIDSSGLSALVSGLKALREQDGKMYLCHLLHQARTALRLTLLDRVFPIFPSVEQALDEGDIPNS